MVMQAKDIVYAHDSAKRIFNGLNIKAPLYKKTS